MPRKTREIQFPGALFHAIVRGNNRQNIFFSDDDRSHFYHLLEEGCFRFKYRIHAFCLMTNHVHLLLEVGDVPLAKIMHNLAFRHAQHLNKKLDRVGHIFQGRYKAILVQNQNYLIDLCKYIHLNPLKAKMVENLVHYHWSSHRAYLGIDQIPWLTTEYILSSIKQIFQDTMTYQNFIQNESQGSDREHILFLSDKNELIINDKIILKYQNSIQRPPKLELNTIIDIVSRSLQIEKDRILSDCMQHSVSKARTFIAIFIQQYTDITLQELANIFNRDASTISHAIYRWQIRCKNNKKDLSAYEKIRDEITKVSKSQG
jgi:putative transposase